MAYNSRGKHATFNSKVNFDTASTWGQRKMRPLNPETSSYEAGIESVDSSFPICATADGPHSWSDSLVTKPSASPSSGHQRSTFPQESVVLAQERQEDSMRLQNEDQSRRIQELESKLNQYMPVSVAHFDQAIADLRRTLKPADHRDELAALHKHIKELIKERDDDRAKAIELEKAMEDTIERRCQKMKKIYDISMDAKIAEGLAAGKKQLERMTEDRDSCENRAVNLLNKLTQAESNYDSLLQREDSFKDDLRAKINALQKTVRDMEETNKTRDTRALPSIRSSSRLADMAREQDVKYKRKIDQLTQERDSALAQVSSLSRRQDTPRKRPRR